MSRPGNTKAYTAISDAWVQLALQYDPANGGDIKEGQTVADGWLVTGSAYNWEWAINSTTPTFSGHPMAAGDSLNGTHKDFIRKLWVRNGTAGSNAVYTMTPTFSL